MTDELQLQPGNYHRIMGKFADIPRHIYAVSEHVNLKEMLLKYRMVGMEETISEVSPHLIGWVKPDGQPFDPEETRAKIEENMVNEIEEYLPILFNQALVMICTVFEVFLADCFNVITRRQPRVLISLAEQSDSEISIKEIINLGDYDKIFEAIQAKVLKQFDFRGIDGKIKTFKKMTVNMDDIFKFKFHSSKVSAQYPEAHKTLIEFYEKRNDIVHRNLLPLRNYQDLEHISGFFSYLLMSFGWVLSEKFRIPNDFPLPDMVKNLAPPDKLTE